MRNARTIIFLLLVLIVAFLSLATRCFYLQYLRSDYYHSVCTRQQQSYNIQRPQRGVILDCRGRILAASNKIQTVFAEPRIIENTQSISTRLAKILNMNADEIVGFIENSKNPGFVKIKIDASQNQCDTAQKIYGIGVESDWRRNYPAGTLASSVVGFTSIDNRGLAGIELQYDKQLAGSAGRNTFLADAHRRPVCLKQQSGNLSDGAGIILTIDAAIQQFARNELMQQYKSYNAESAVAIVAEPKTGEILAMVSLPDFDPDPSAITSSDPNNFRNRAVTDQFEPGSIIKPIVTAIALDAGVVNHNEKIFCENGNYRGKGFGRIGEYNNHQYGNLPIREILIKSSNIGMAKIGQKLGKDRLYKGLTLFGFGKKTGLDLPAEAEGLLRTTDKWTGYSVTRIPFGQEISTTAIQIMRAFCILANGGRSVRPFLVKAIVDGNGKVIELKQPQLSVGFVISPEVARWVVTDPMVGVVNEKQNGGTGWRAKLEKWQVFGKTGTADIAKTDEKGYSDDATIASFIAGAPAEDPAVLVLVSIRKPDKNLGKGHTGGAVASPVAAKILEKTLNYLEKHQY